MSVFSTFAFILVLLAVGRVLSWRRIVPDNAAESLNLVVLYVLLPAAVLLYAPKITFERELIGLVAVPWIVLAASIVLSLAAAKAFGFARDSTAVLLMQVPLSNTSFIGYSLIPVLAGAGALRYALIYDQLGTFIILVTYGLALVAWYGGGARPTPASILRRVVSFPPVIALVVAILFMPAEPPPSLDRSLHLLADALLPIVVLALGMQLRLRLPRRYIVPLVVGLVAKLVLMPLLALGLAIAFGLSPTMRDVAVYMTALPPMVTAGALLAMAGLAPELAAAMIGYGIVLSMFTLPAWHHVLSQLG